MSNISKVAECQGISGCKGKGLKSTGYPEELIPLKHYSPPLFAEKMARIGGKPIIFSHPGAICRTYGAGSGELDAGFHRTGPLGTV
ncbi:hypothetical protein C6A37_04540 [Desulfobacteraceae bacterium SEEP-SAG9]|nr:hypothetical protein C6A37_04540 [Desulfobacteraceae bacterium SEEP-SAG9]